MAFGTSSKVFANWIGDVVNRTTTLDMNTNTLKIALYGNTGTPDNTVSSANSAYNAGQWVSGNEITATGWTAGGLTLAGVASTVTSATYTFDATDKAGGATDTVTAAYGCLIFDATSAAVTNQGICYLAFGGSNSVVAGTFTVVFNASGIMTIAA